MDATAHRHLWSRAGAALAALTIGIVLFLVLYGSTLPADPTSVPAAEAARITLLMGADLLLGLVAVALLPLALRPTDPRTEPVIVSRVPLHTAQPVPAERRGPLVAGALIVAATVLSSVAVPATMIVIVSFMTRRRPWWAAVVVALFFAASWTNAAIVPTDEPISFAAGTVSLTGVMGICFLIGMTRRSRREKMVAVEQEAAATRREQESLRREQDARLEQARIAERTRIAREMHDTLSHRLSLIAVHAGALEYGAAPDAEARMSTAGTIRETARTAAEELRDVLSVLRDAPADTAPQASLVLLDELADSSRAAGLPVRVEVAAPLTRTDLAALPELTSRTLFRVVQESLTNAAKHAPGRDVDVRFAAPDGNRIVVTVTNTFPATSGDAPGNGLEGPPGSGLGLVGLAERAELLGGRFAAGPQGDRFVVRAELPWPG